ncbi:MAG: nucleoside triphosphate pyrophosphohydrolase [Hyphomicrobiales bacterium]|nr:MAG: nucleoside triphosphate pyrophosphohydrolase [Hyphomicrobiales bacterium]
MEPSRNISRLLEIMTALRTPKTGCPWDLEQDFKSIIPYTIEEAYEVADAIERNDMEDLRLELGDLLLQSVYHAQMASEAGDFDFGDVVEGITTKMIRRHPHVFGTEDASAEQYSAAGMAKGTWEKIKAEEKSEQIEARKAKGLPPKPVKTSILDDVPNTLPSLAVGVKLQQKASKVGFDWNDPKAVISKIREELDEVEAELKANDKEKLTDEIGDVLFAMVNLARHLEIDPDTALRSTNQKFRKRFSYIEKNLTKSGEKIEDVDLDTMEDLWKRAKKEL